MAPDLTQHDEIRQRILTVLASAKSYRLPPQEVRAILEEDFSWTQDDGEPFPSSSTGDPKWWTRTTIQRNRMANDGLIDRTDLRVWKLTDTGKTEARLRTPKSWSETDGTSSSASPLNRALASQRVYTRDGDAAAERTRREQLWASLLAAGGPVDVQRNLLRDLKIYGGQAGIFVPNAETRTPATPKGIAMSFLHTGRHYDDELTATGVIYHYPTTARTGHDKSEIEASHAAYRATLPVFVIGPGSKSTTRTVYRGYIEDVDDKNKVLLITFTRAELPPPPTPSEVSEAFNLTDKSAAPSFSARRNRPNQVRFAFDVYKRYGTECAVCGLNVQGLLQAAHLLSKKDGGSDDARNGLPLCANHHLAFDRGYWCVDTDLKLHAQSNGPALFDLAIPRTDLTHLPRLPHQDALAKVWTDWKAKQPGTA